MSEDANPWFPLDSAPTNGRVIEARGPNWGHGQRLTAYRARRLGAVWINSAEPREELEHLVEWREAPPHGSTLDQLFDDLPIAALPEDAAKDPAWLAANHATPAHAQGLIVEMLHAIVDAQRTGDDAGPLAILALARALPTPGYRFEKPRWHRCPECAGAIAGLFGGDFGATQACIGAGEETEDGCGWRDDDVLPSVFKKAAAVPG